MKITPARGHYHFAKLHSPTNGVPDRIYCHITPELQELHWLTVRSRIKFKILLMTFKAIHGLALTYIMDLVSVKKKSP